LLLLSTGIPGLAQKQIPQNPNRYDADGSKKGKWTILYNEDDIETNDPSSTAYYRLITYKKGIIDGPVVENYISGTRKWEGFLVSDDPDSLTGINKWYNYEGILVSKLQFSNDSIQITSSRALHPDRSNKKLTLENSLEFYGGFLMKKKRYPEAIAIYQTLLQMLRDSGAKPEVMARVFQSTGTSWLFLDEYVNALTNYQLAYQISERKADHLLAYLKSGECLISLEQYDSAHYFLNKSIDLQKSLDSTKSYTYSLTLDQSGLAHYYLDDYTSAIDRFKKSLGILKSLGLQISVDYIPVLHHAALAYAKSGSYPEALKAQKLGVTLASKVFDKGSPDIAFVQMQLAKVYLYCGQPNLAIKEALPSLPVLNRNKDSNTNMFIEGLIITGEIYEDLSLENLVEYYYNLALSTIDQKRGSYNIDYTQLLSRLAKLQFVSGRFDVSRENYLSLRLLWSTLMGESYKNLGECHFNLGIISLSQGDLLNARNHFMDALDIYQINKSGYMLDLGDTYEKLAEITYQLEDLDQSTEYAQRCIEVRNQAGDISLSNVYSILGNIKLRQGKLDEARDNFDKSLTRSMDQHGPGHVSTFQANFDLARLYEQTGDQKNALAHLSKAGEIFRDQLIPAFHFLPENAKIQFYPKLDEFRKYYLGFHLKQSYLDQTALSELGSFVTASKYFVLNPYDRIENMVHVTGKNEVEIAFKEWTKSWMELSSVCYDLNKIQRSHEISDNLNKAIKMRESILMGGSEAIRYLLGSEKVTSEEIFKQTKPGDEVIETFRHKSNPENIQYGFIHYKKGTTNQIKFNIVKNGFELENEGFKIHYNNMKSTNSENDSYQKFFSPIEEMISGTGVVYFSPAGIYNKINLSSLQRPDGTYNIDKYDIRNISGLNQITGSSIPPSTQKQMVLVGDPDFNYSIDTLTQVSVPDLQDVKYLPVKGSSFEVTLVGNLLDEVEWYHIDYFQQNAIEKYISDSYNPAILHISTHGFFYNQELPGYYHSPILKTGLLLTSGNFTIPEMNEMSSRHVVNLEDGFLSNYEISGLNLERTHTAFLSLSGSDYQSTNNSEGYGSLMKALNTAGVHYQIMTLWEQDVSAKDEFIRQFYKEWLGNKDVRSSFNKAIQKIRNDSDHPFYWGGMVLVGK